MRRPVRSLDRDRSGEHSIKSEEKLRSGMMEKSSTNVKTKLVWPQKQLGYRYIQEPLSFNQLTFDHLVVGEIATVRNCTDSNEIKHRLRLLERVGYWKLRGAEWPQIRAFYAAILAGIEADEFGWEVDYGEFESMIIDKPLASAAIKPDRRNVYKTKNRIDNWYCKEFNTEEGCSLEPGHIVITPKGDQKAAAHICAKCWKIKKVRKEHSECSSECPLRQ